MNLQAFETAVNAIEIDPRPRVKAVVVKIIANELAGVPAELADRLMGARLEALAARLRDTIESGRFVEIDGLLDGLRSGLRAAVLYERQRGELKGPPTPSDQIKAFASDFAGYLWNGFESNCLMRMLKPDERIVDLGFRAIKTSTRTISRADLHSFADSQRPRWAEDDAYFERNFTAPATIDEAERAALRVAERQNTYSSGPARLIGTAIRE